MQGVDIAWARPTTDRIKATGAHFVCRYLSPDSSKNITKAEVQDYKANGLAVVVVWESTANRMLGDFAAGAADAHAAEVQRAAVGLPNDTVIYFACDFDAQGAQLHTINNYMRGVNSVIGVSRTGFYGGYYTVESVASAPATARYFWQTVAWSGGNKSAHANIYQPGGTTLGGNADIDTALTADYGQYPRPSAAPSPAPAPAPVTNGADMPYWFPGQVAPGATATEVLPPCGNAWSATTQRMLHLGFDEVGTPDAKASVRVAFHDGTSWASVQTVTVTAAGGRVDVPFNANVQKISLQSASGGVGFAVEVW